MSGTVGAVLRAIQAFGIVATFPAVESLRTNAKVTTGKTSIVAMGTVVIKLFQPLARRLSIKPPNLPSREVPDSTPVTIRMTPL